MSANSAPRHLRLAVCAAALLLASTPFNGSIATAAPAADLDTLIMASLQNSGRSDAGTASQTSESKASGSKSAAAKKLAAKRLAKKKKVVEPMVVQIAPQQGGGGLLAAIGAVGGGSTPTVDVKPLPSQISSAPRESRVDRSSSESGPRVYATSGYGQSEWQTQPSTVVAQQAPSFAFGMSSAAVSAPMLDSTEKLAGTSKPAKSGKTAPKQIAAAAGPAAEAPAQPSGLSAFLASLGFGDNLPSASEAKPDSAAVSATSAISAAALNDGAKERSKSDLGVTASIGHASAGSKSASKSSATSDKSASSSTPAHTASVTGSSAVSKPALSDRSIGISSKSASLDTHAKSGSHDQSKADVASTASIGTGSAGSAAPRISKPASSRAVPSVAAAESAPARASAPMPASQSGGLFAALGVAGGNDSNQVETTAQIPVAYPEPVIVNRNVAMPRREMAISPGDPAYRVDAGDKLRVVVYGQEGLTNSYAIDAGGGITMPLIGRVVARGLTPAALAADITGRLRKGFIREPSVAVEIEAYRPFFILGEVAAPGQYPYVPNMSVEAAVAIAGGFSPRARRDSVTLTHRADGGQYRESVPLGTSLSPGDTITVGERWF